MSPARTWTTGNWRARLNVLSVKGPQIFIAHVGCRSSRLLDGAGLLFVEKKKTGDYHGEMCSDFLLKWLENQILPQIRGACLWLIGRPIISY